MSKQPDVIPNTFMGGLEMENGMYPETTLAIIICPKGWNWGWCTNGIWNPPLICPGSNNILLQNWEVYIY